METWIIFKLFTAEFKTKHKAEEFIKDIAKLREKHDPEGKNIRFTYELVR